MAGKFDVVVIGAGVVGLACAQRLARDGLRVLALDQAGLDLDAVAERTSGVAHSGIHHPAGWHKTTLCIQGRRLLRQWVEERGVSHDFCGKLILEADDTASAQLDALVLRAKDRGVEFALVDGEEARDLQPGLRKGLHGAWFPESFVVSVAEFMLSLRRALLESGGALIPRTRVLRISTQGFAYRLTTPDGEFEAPMVVNAAGPAAPVLARCLEISLSPVRMCRGDYFRWVNAPVGLSRLVYSLVNDSGGLGIHLTPGLGAAPRIGPDTQWLDVGSEVSEEGDRPSGVTFSAWVASCWSTTEAPQLEWASYGLRPKLHGPEGGARDFEMIHYPQGLVHLNGIESPGLTASLAIAEWVSAQLA